MTLMQALDYCLTWNCPFPDCEHYDKEEQNHCSKYWYDEIVANCERAVNSEKGKLSNE